MTERKWYWEEVDFIPHGVKPEDMLRLPWHIFIKSTVVEELKAKGKFKEKERKGKKKKRANHVRYQKRTSYVI